MTTQSKRTALFCAGLAAFQALIAAAAQAQAVSFIARRDFDGGENLAAVVLGDFNGDGLPDLAIAGHDTLVAYVSVLLSNGDGTFQPALYSVVRSQPQSIAVGDFNGDGVPDLAVDDGSSDSVSVLLGNGDGTFQAARNFYAWLNPVSVAVGDFNGDGVLDLAVANNNLAGTVSVLLGNGDGTFQPLQSFVARRFPVSVAVGDFDRDGRQDLVVANHYSNNVSRCSWATGMEPFRPRVPSRAGTSHLSPLW